MLSTRVPIETKLQAQIWALKRSMSFQDYVEMALKNENERQDDLERRLARPEFSD